MDKEVKIKMNSKLPWEGKVKIEMKCKEGTNFTLHIRIPSWTQRPSLKINGEKVPLSKTKDKETKTASGYNPFESFYIKLQRTWDEKNDIELTFPMYITKNTSHPKVITNMNKISLSRGPLVYCFESTDNENRDVPDSTIDSNSKILKDSLDELGDVISLKMKDEDGNTLIAIPYFLWGNRGKSSMQVWVKIS